jgi:deoxycytidylate deaminase
MSNQEKAPDTGVVSIHGKEYKTVARRIADFRSDETWLGYSIQTEVISADDLVQVRAMIRNAEDRIVATGHGDEKRGSTNINKTSALENAETSAIGRALAFLHGDLAGTEIASADEVANAINQQKEYEQVEKLIAHNAAVKEHWDSVAVTKKQLALASGAPTEEEAVGCMVIAYEAYFELPEQVKFDLRLAATKGGIFTTEETKQIKSDLWGKARKAYHGEEAAA